MELSELTAYVKEKYNISEQRKWEAYPGFSVLADPTTDEWLAFLIREWSEELGEEIARCDIKCGRESLRMVSAPYVTTPFRMRGDKWVGVVVGDDTDRDVVFRLFDRAVVLTQRRGYAVVLDDLAKKQDGVARTETAIPFSTSGYKPPDAIPLKIREMRRLYEYGTESLASRSKNFYMQAKFMEDFEEEADIPWTSEFFCYYPTYHDMSTNQLRAYFSWRKKVRRGEFTPISTSAAYVYVYELLNCVGARSPEDALEKLQRFEEGFIDSGVGDKRMRAYIERWKLEFSVLNDIPPDVARSYLDKGLMKRDSMLSMLNVAEFRTDEEVFSALSFFGDKKILKSPVITKYPDRGVHLFAEVWREAIRTYRGKGKDFFAMCFGKRRWVIWQPLAQAVYGRKHSLRPREYVLNENRSYRFTSGDWEAYTFDKTFFKKDILQDFLRESDAYLRRYLKTGRYLKIDEDENWVKPIVEAVIAEDERAAMEAARPKITIDMSALDAIREAAITTRDSLLTEDELDFVEEEVIVKADAAPQKEVVRESLSYAAPPSASPIAGVLTEVQKSVIIALLRGLSTKEIIKTNRLMPTIVADGINDALFDHIGDTCVYSEDDELYLVEDYVEDIKHLIGEV